MYNLQADKNSIEKLTEKILDGYRMGRKDDFGVLLTAPLEAVCEGADAIRRKFCGNKADLCTIVNGRSGRCSEDCRFAPSPAGILPAPGSILFLIRGKSLRKGSETRLPVCTVIPL